MNYGEGGLSASDVALLSGNTGRSNDGFGEGSGWWIIVFLIFALGGWGRNGFGGGFGGGNSGGVADNYVLATDFATIERKLDGVNNGLCDGFYAMAQQFSNTNQNIANSTAAVQQTLCQGFSGVNQSIVTNGYETRLGINGIASQLADCCCDIKTQIADCCCTTQRAIDAVNYNMATNTCSITNAINNSTRDLIDNQNANYRALHDEIVANRIEDKNAQIQAQQNEINSLRLAASQERQNNYLINELKPCPIPAYITCNPYQSAYGYNFNNCGCNSGCGC